MVTGHVVRARAHYLCAELVYADQDVRVAVDREVSRLLTVVGREVDASQVLTIRLGLKRDTVHINRATVARDRAHRVHQVHRVVRLNKLHAETTQLRDVEGHLLSVHIRHVQCDREIKELLQVARYPSLNLDRGR